MEAVVSFGVPQLISVFTAAAGFVGAIAALMATLLNSKTIAAQIAGILVALAILIFTIAVLVLALKKEVKS